MKKYALKNVLEALVVVTTITKIITLAIYKKNKTGNNHNKCSPSWDPGKLGTENPYNTIYAVAKKDVIVSANRRHIFNMYSFF